MIRPFRDNDDAACLAIVDEAWDFAGHLEPRAVAEFAKRLYTLVSLAESNYAVVVEETGTVVGFLFGRAGDVPKHRTVYSGIRGRLRLLREFILLRGLSRNEKWRWFKAINRHQVNRARLGVLVNDEVTLFAAAAAARGNGYGRSDGELRHPL